MTKRINVAPLVALRYRDYRLLWVGQMISVTGSQMQSATLNWHIYQLTHEPIYLGLLGLARVVPIIIFSLVGGVVADAIDRRRLMVVTQSAMALCAAILALLTFNGTITVWLIFLLAALAASAVAFDLPARQALVPRLVERKHLPNALALFSMMFQFAAIVGPLPAGLFIAIDSLGFAYAFNAVSFLAVIVGLLLMRTDTAPRPGEAQPVSLRAAVEGLHYVWQTPIIRYSMLLDFLATFFSSANQLLPVMVQSVLKVGPKWYALLYAAPSIGSLVAGMIMSLLGTIHRQGRILLSAVAVYGIATLVFGFSIWPLLSFLALAGTGAADTVSMVLRNTIRQLTTPDQLRGRMTSVNMIFFMGGPQLGEFEAAGVAQLWGAPLSVVTGGIGCLFVTAWIAAKVPVLREYRSGPAGAS
jgi:MFS family permease